MASVKREGMWKSVLTTRRTSHVCESPERTSASYNHLEMWMLVKGWMSTGILIAVEFVQYIRYVHLLNELAMYYVPYFFSLCVV